VIICDTCGAFFSGAHVCPSMSMTYCNACERVVPSPHFCPKVKPMHVRVETPVMHTWCNFVVIRTKTDNRQPVGTYFEKYDEARDCAVKMTEETRLGHTVYRLAIVAQARPQAPAVQEYPGSDTEIRK